MKTFDGYKKRALTDEYALLAGGGHKPLSEFSMAHTHPYLPLAGGTMTGALNFKNGTWNLMGDDAYIGDCNMAGMIGVKGANATTPGFALYNNSGTLLGKLYASGSTLIWSGGTIQATTFNGNAATASKLGTSTIGATNIPIYLNGGTPTTVNLNSTANNLINNLTTETSIPVDADYYISQYIGGGTTTITYHRRPHSALYAYIKNKAEGTWNISAAKIGTLTIGSTIMPVYINKGVPTIITSFPESYLSWGGKNFSGSYGPIDAAIIPNLGANRLAFMPASGVEIQYSTNNGSTWLTYSTSNYNKINLFNGNGSNYIIGASSATGIDKSQYQLRIIITTNIAQVYTQLNKFCIYCTTGGSSGCWCTIDAMTKANVDNGTNTWQIFADKVSISGWSGYNIINISSLTTYGNWSSLYQKVRFTFGVTSHPSSSKYAGLSIIKIMGFGGVGWVTPSTMAATGKMYIYDANKNVTFPAKVISGGFSGNLEGNATTATTLQTARTLTIGNTGKSFNGSSNISWSLSEIGAASSGHTHTFASLTSKPTTLSGYNITDSLYSIQVSTAQDNVTWAKSIAKTNRRAFYYNTNGVEYSYLFGFSSGNTSSGDVNYGAVLKMGYSDSYLRILRVYRGNWQTSDWEKISAGYADSAGKWTTARTLTIGNTGKSVNGSANVSWSLAEIGASATTHTHSVKINGTTKTIAASGEAAVDLGNYKTPQTAVSDPIASGTSISFIDTISLNTNGVIVATKKIVPIMRGATTSIAGIAGLVPAPAANLHALFLKGDGTWATPSDTHWTTHLYIGAKDATSNVATTNGNTYIKVTDNSTIRNLYIIKGTGRTTVASDADGNITITSPTVTWSEISDKPSTFAPSTHNHPTSQIDALTNYTKATAAAALATNDSLNAALGKLEYKLDIAYDLVTKANDSDGTIENLKEILDVLAGIKDTETIKAIIGKYLPLTGGTLTGNLWFGAGNTDKYITFTSATTGTDTNHSWRIGYIGSGSDDGKHFVLQSTKTTTNTWTNALSITNEGLAATFTGTLTASKFIGILNNTLTFSTGIFTAKTYNNSSAITVNIPTHTSHLVNNSGFLTLHLSLANYVTLNTALTITNCKIFRMNAPADDRETVYYNIGLKLSSFGDYHKKVAAIGMGNEIANWYKAAIGFERTNTYDRGDIVFLLNNSGDNTTCTYSDIKIRIKASGNINTLGSISANGFIKTDSSDSYILLGGGGHKAIFDFMLKTDELSNNLTTISKSLTVTKDWMDTGIKNTDLPANGTYIIQVSANNTADSIRHNYWSGIMSWYKDGTDDSDSDEIILHRAGHAYGHTIYLRTIMTTSSDGRHLRLQIAADTNLSTAVTYTFKFKRVI